MSEHQSRIDRVRAALPSRGIDALLISHPSNRFYLTGFTADDTPPDESAGYLIITPQRAVLVTGSVNVTQAEAQAPHIKVVKNEWRSLAEHAQVIADAGVTRLGYEPHALLVGVKDGLDAELHQRDRTIAWVPVEDVVEELRAVKTPAELELLRRAFDIACQAFERVAPTIQAGQTERQVAWALHGAMVELGAEGPSFPSIVAAGTNAARPHHEPGDRVIAEGEPIVIDMGARYHGYCSDLTRTVWVGRPDDKLREVYAIVDGAVEAVFERLHPGLSGLDMDKAARDYIESRGYGEQFSHGLGHGVGVRVHEAPSAYKESTDTLQAGHVITIEPGIYMPDWGGVRIEDVVLITADGFEVLTRGASKMRPS